MTIPIHVLQVDDSESDAILILAALRRNGYAPEADRVWTRAALEAALARRWDAILCDYAMPQFDGLSALALVKQRHLDIPFIIISGAIGEETAVEAMKAGAHDYVMKHDLGRLPAVLRREMAEAEIRRTARRAEANLRASEALLNSIVNTAADGIIVVDADYTIEFANPAIERMFGYKPIEIIGRNLDQLLPPAGPGAAGGGLLSSTACPTPAEPASCEARARRRNGNLFQVELSITQMQFDDAAKMTIMMRDISERLRAEERIRHLAHFDDLSGLPNRALFCQLFERALHQAQSDGKSLAVMFIDLDRFKIINDTLGHDAGDMALRQVASRLTNALAPTDAVARFGGDEFAVLVHDVNDPVALGATAQCILNALTQPFVLESQEYHLSASIGISTYPDDSVTVQMLLRNADVAMYRAKEQGKNNYQFYSAQMNVHSFERLVLERFLRRALDQDEFQLAYQPKVDIGSGRLVGMEVLLRWQNPALGTVAPDRFIPLAEETGLIVPIGMQVLRRACSQTCAWIAAGFHPIRVAVNLSARQFLHESLVADIESVLRETALDADALELEITESMVMQHPEHAASLLCQLRALGIHLAIDDFGTGYSSLGYLKRFPVDSVKIDRSFIRDIPADSDDVAITRAVIAMAHSLRLQVTAEGVETREQAEFLRAHGCDHMQGYLVGRPMSAAEFQRVLSAPCAELFPRQTALLPEALPCRA